MTEETRRNLGVTFLCLMQCVRESSRAHDADFFAELDSGETGTLLLWHGVDGVSRVSNEIVDVDAMGDVLTITIRDESRVFHFSTAPVSATPTADGDRFINPGENFKVREVKGAEVC